MLFINQFVFHIIQVFLFLPQIISAILFYTILFLFTLLLLKLFRKLLWKVIIFIYCFFIYLILTPIINVLYYKTNQQIWYLLDNKIHKHLYKSEIIIKQKNIITIEKIDRILKKLLIFILTIILIFLLISNFNRKKMLPNIVQFPFQYYSNLEQEYSRKYNLERSKKDTTSAITSEKTSKKKKQKKQEPKKYVLTKAGVSGSNLRKNPELDNTTPIVTTVSGDIILEGTGEMETDKEGYKWIKVKTPDGTEGWINNKLIKSID